MYEKYIARNGNNLYRKMLHDVLKNGITVNPRGKRTLEIQAVTHILEPRERVLTVPGRAANPFFNVAENLAILGAWQDQRSWLSLFNKNILQFFDNEKDEQMWAFYGDRLRRWPMPSREKGGHKETTHSDKNWKIDQLQEITKKLLKDRSSRQAVATLWHPALDNEEGHRDYPCNFAVKFYIRDVAHYGPDGRNIQKNVSCLHMTVFNRSNDIHWGLFAVNLSQWSFIQEVMAITLGVEVGNQIHVSDSLHLYTDSEPHNVITENMAKYKEGFDIYSYTLANPLFNQGFLMTTWGNIDRDLKIWKERFDAFMKGDTVVKPEFDHFIFLNDAWYFLQAYINRRDRNVALTLLRGVQDNALWVAGVEWMMRHTGMLKSTQEILLPSVKAEIESRFPASSNGGIVMGGFDTKGKYNSAQDAVLQYILSSNMLNNKPEATTASKT